MVVDIFIDMLAEEVDKILKQRLVESERRHQEVVDYFKLVDAEMAQDKIETEIIHSKIRATQDSIRDSLNELDR